MGTVYIGSSDINSSGSTIAADVVHVARVSLREDADIEAVVFRADGTTSAVNVKGVLYTCDPATGKPDALIATTPGYNDFTHGAVKELGFSSPVSLSAGEYFAGLLPDASLGIRQVSSQQNLNFTDATGSYAGGAPATFDSAASLLFGRKSIGLRYTNDGTLDAYTFGRTVASGGSVSGPATNDKGVTKYTLSETATVDRLTIIQDHSNLTRKQRLLIYADSGGEPGALLAQSEERFAVPRHFPTDFPLSSPVVLAAGDYWLGVITDGGSFAMMSDTTAGDYRANDDTYSDGASDPFGTPHTTLTRSIPVYAPYTPGGSPPPGGGSNRLRQPIWFGL